MDNYENVCYLIHFDEPVNGKGQHYLGFTKDLQKRVEAHREGTSAQLTARAKRLGIDWRIVRVWRDADLYAEKKLKSIGASKLCPICNPKVSVSTGRSQGRASPSQ